jgi:hypothetical protein
MAAHLKTGIEQILQYIEEGKIEWARDQLVTATEISCFTEDNHELWTVTFDFTQGKIDENELKTDLEKLLIEVTEEWGLLQEPNTREEWHKAKYDKETFFFNKRMVDECFAEKTHQVDVALALYRMVYNGVNSHRPSFDDIQAVDGFPAVGRKAAMYIMGLFVAFDEEHHPRTRTEDGTMVVTPGGTWMNKGFSCDETLGDWECRPAPCTMEEK